MAVIKSTLAPKASGSVGNLTLATVNGQVVMKEKITAKATPVRTRRQMVRRVCLSNIVALYRAFDGLLHPSFEKKDAVCSDYNMFVSANLGITDVYLMKDEVLEGACVSL